jgi:endonuclease YncB( thermonuclease family)
MRALALGLWLVASAVLAEPFPAQVISVHDGDTLTVVAQGKPLRVRLADVDAPELRQSYGLRSKQSLADLCLDKQAHVSVVSHDRSGAALGRVVCDGVDASAEQVQRGMAWVYQRRASSASPLYFLEDQAQRAREGLWADRAPSPPWAYRANRRNYVR